MLPYATNYNDLATRFTWNIPDFYNIGVDICDRWAEREPERLALIYIDEQGLESRLSFADLKSQSNRLANLLVRLGLRRGDRVGILLPQAPETAFGHIAILKAGAISMPLFSLFGPEALAFRLKNSGASLVITNREGAKKLAPLRSVLPDLRHILTVDGAIEASVDLGAGMKAETEEFVPVATRADDPAILIYTSGTTGQPKGALHAHRVLLGHLPGVELSHNLFPQPGDRIWTPADWAWIGGLLDVLMPALHHGVSVVARRFGKFTGKAAFQLLHDYQIRNAFLPPTALKTMRAISNVEESSQAGWRLNMRSVASGGEPLGSALLDWGQRVFGVAINEFYGQTECNMIVSSCSALMPGRQGIMGKPVPGHRLGVLDSQGQEQPPGRWGTIAVRRPDPVMFLGYWNNLDATAEKFIGDWLLTGDTGQWEEDGWLRFIGREDDVITSSGYRIGPGEIEDCLSHHPAVRMAAVIGYPDSERTEIVKAFIQLEEGYAPSQALADEIRDFVKTRLAAHEYPRIVEFVESLPMTATGKIVRKALRT